MVLKDSIRKCAGCHAIIIWIVTPAGKRAPLDAIPEKRWVQMRPGAWQLVDTYMPHHATCPEVDRFRMGRKA